jgi:hypothetical protein
MKKNRPNHIKLNPPCQQLVSSSYDPANGMQMNRCGEPGHKKRNGEWYCRTHITVVTTTVTTTDEYSEGCDDEYGACEDFPMGGLTT